MDIRLKKAPCGFLSTNDEGKITEVNETFLRWTDYTEQQLLGKHIEFLLSPTNKLLFHSYFYPAIQLKNLVEEFFISLRDKNKKAVPLLMNAKRYIRDGEEVIDYMMMKMQHRLEYEREVQSLKIQAEEAYEKKSQAFDHLEEIYAEIEQKQNELMAINLGLIELSNTDKLTGLYNRRYFSQKMSEFIRAFDMESVQFSLLIIDIDHFKRVNDTHGHQAGDEILKLTARLIRTALRANDCVARLGGDEFAVLLPGISLIDARQLGDRLCHILRQGGIVVSIGVAAKSEVGSLQKTQALADERMYEHKRRNCCAAAVDIHTTRRFGPC